MWKASTALLGESLGTNGEVGSERVGEAKASEGDEPLVGLDAAVEMPAAALARLRSATKAAARALASILLLADGDVDRLPAGEMSTGSGGSWGEAVVDAICAS